MKKKTATEPAEQLDTKLSELLLQTTILTEEQLATVQAASAGSNETFERILLQEGYVNDEQLGKLKASANGWRYLNLYNESIEEPLIHALSEEFAFEHLIVPFRRNPDEPVSVAMANPDDRKTIRILRKKYGPDMTVYYTTQSAVSSALSQYDASFRDRTSKLLQSHATATAEKNLDDGSIIEFVDNIILHGVRKGASDIHIEPTAHDSVVRERIDGVLHKELTFSKDVHSLLTLRIKVLANLPTDEHAEPLDGKILYDTPEGKRADLRVSIVPTTQGEKIVLRLLVSQDSALGLDDLGMMGVDLEYLSESLHKSWGMILVTGPTGAGKTTSLYAALRRLNSDDVNIATIEDPAEYDLPGANQIQVNEKAGLTFSRGLRSIVRQDPDVILVGEIRDKETASIAINSAMTGHLVLSTLHTNDAATAIPRLIDMGIEPFLISSTVDAVVAQRLVRENCIRCRQSQDVSIASLKESLPSDLLKKLARGKKTVRVYAGKGCKVCNNTGYKGRIGVFEVLRVDEAIHTMIMKNADAEAIHKAAVKAGMNTMMDDGIEKVIQGMTTIDELLRVLHA